MEAEGDATYSHELPALPHSLFRPKQCRPNLRKVPDSCCSPVPDPSATAPSSAPARRPLLKICGLRDPVQANAIASMGVDAIGVVAVPGSPRFLSVVERSSVFLAAQDAHPGCLGVLVVADPTDADLPNLTAEQGHQVVQLHGGESVERCRELRDALGPHVGIWKALRISSRDDLHLGQLYGEVVDALLLDAWVPDKLGGTGCSISLPWLEGFTPPIPWWLAGGISPESVGQVLATVHPYGLDASSAVEERPGWKDLGRVRKLWELVLQSASPSEAWPAA